MKKTIISFGEILWDILPTGKIIGGAPFNFAFRVNSLGDRGIMISRLGRDELGQKALESVLSLGLETKYLQWDDSFPTGTVQVGFDEQNNPDYFIVPNVAYDHIHADDDIFDIASQADCICFGTLSQRSEKNRRTLKALLESSENSLKLCDINLRKKCFQIETVVFSLERADVLKINEDEAHELARLLDFSNRSIIRICEKLTAEFSLSFCTVTLAEYGAFSLSDYGESIYVAGYKIEAVDSLGTGDAFSAGFIHQILRGKSLAEACESGNKQATLVAAQRGGTGVVTRDQINRFNDENFKRNTHPEFI